MRTIVLVGLLLVGLTARAAAGRGHSHSESHSNSHSRSSDDHVAGKSGTGSSSASHAVRGYTTKRGTYVAPHRQTDADHTQRNNYSTKGNVNPSNGKVGTKYARH
jgi:hypothetical protein